MTLKSILLKISFLIGAGILLSAPVCHADNFAFQPSVSMRGKPKYAPDFKSFDYVNPDAPKKGTLKQSAFGSFDTFNPFIINGIPPAGIGLMYDTLMKQSADEVFSLYGLIADGIFILPDNKGVAFHINPQARFSDNHPITAQDVAFSFQILKEKGVPTYRYYYQDVRHVEIINTHTIVFHFHPNTQNPELPFILGELPILPAHWWQDKDFTKTTLEKPVGSGPYQIDTFEVGRRITYKRLPHYWASNLNVNKGFYNFDTVVFEYYRDTTVAVEAFKAHEFDIRLENEAKKWAHFKTEQAVQDGQIKMTQFKHGMPSGMQGYVFNLRRPLFQDIRVRQALSLAFDFDWMNQNLFYGLYTRTTSFFDNSYLKAPLQPTLVEQTVWEQLPFQDVIRYQNPLPNTTYFPLRTRLKQALDLLKQAGWHVNNKGILVDKNQKPFTFDILFDAGNSATWERVTLPYIAQLKRLGIQANIRSIDSIQYKNRLDSFEYDMIVGVWGQSLSPGNEQRYFWGSSSARQNGSMNYSGIENPVIDALIEKIIQADTAEKLTASTQALDRALQNMYIVIPHWYSPYNRFIYWHEIQMPEQTPLKGVNPMTWWKKQFF